ncbi:hypothetical protein GCM10007362_22330 [Saccharibacillus endophyticus]|uniref:Uncharacterized protein n=1 Tax=Saccharibacillus endophyticus TaxID=2060666 RepID=A0ABQ1ZT71_9BACL|nr:hypothetical protein GCM10007362_22330 [Saccharibacillus endophyticus]
MGRYPWSVLIVIVYALPFAYFGMQQDYSHQSVTSQWSRRWAYWPLPASS